MRVHSVGCRRRDDTLECKLDLDEDRTFLQRLFGYRDEEVRVDRVEIAGENMTGRVENDTIEFDRGRDWIVEDDVLKIE